MILADLLMAAGALAAGAWCFVLSRRLRALSRLDSGVGGAVALLSAQVDDLTKALAKAEAATQGSTGALAAASARAEAAARRIELLLASLHGLPEPEETVPQVPVFVRHGALRRVA